MYIIYSLLYALFSGFYKINKKLAGKNSNSLSILVLFTTGSFLLSLIWAPLLSCFNIELILILFAKGFICAIAFYLIIKLLKSINISGLTLNEVLSTLFVFVGGILYFNESASLLQYVGCAVIVLSSVLINLVSKNDAGKLTLKSITLLVISALLSASTCFIDKYTTQFMPVYDNQFWFLMSLCIWSWIFVLFTSLKCKKFVVCKKDFKNYFIYLVAIFLFVGDIFLFIAYKQPGAQMILISTISKLKTIFFTLFGVFIFKEEHKLFKILIAILAVVGVILISI